MNTFGLTIEDFNTLNDLVFTPLKKMGATVYVFGSRATQKNQPFSDIDILLEVPPYFDRSLYSQIVESIEEARFPVKVDFVLSDHLAESYRERVNIEKIKV